MMKHSEGNLRDRSRASNDDEEAEAAGRWLARRDRGLTEQEKIEFTAWLAADALRATLLRRLEESFHALDQATRLRPPEAVRPDPDFLLRVGHEKLKRPRVPGKRRPEGRHRLIRFSILTGLAAAAIALGTLAFRAFQAPNAQPAGHGYVARYAPQQKLLPDGSRVEFKDGAQVEVAFTASERRVRLSHGDAHFTVTKDPTRPFIVVAGDVAVRAVGTAFSVSHAGGGLEVVVSEGSVRVDDLHGRSLLAADTAVPINAASAESLAPSDSALSMGQRVVIPITHGVPAPAPVAAVTSDEMARVLAWRSTWLEFVEMPLSKVAEEFNAHVTGPSRHRIRLANAATERVLVSGKFRADEIDTFVRLLGSSFDVTAATAPDGSVVLRKVP